MGGKASAVNCLAAAGFRARSSFNGMLIATLYAGRRASEAVKKTKVTKTCFCKALILNRRILHFEPFVDFFKASHWLQGIGPVACCGCGRETQGCRKPAVQSQR
jgi:hypothetical protein